MEKLKFTLLILAVCSLTLVSCTDDDDQENLNSINNELDYSNKKISGGIDAPVGPNRGD